MPNKFTQSVLQRVEQEQKTQSKPKAQTKTVASKPDEPKKSRSKPTPAASKGSVKTNIPDISDYLRLESTRIAKNKTFYLDVEVIDALCETARRQNVTDSKLCNDILRRILGIRDDNG